MKFASALVIVSIISVLLLNCVATSSSSSDNENHIWKEKSADGRGANDKTQPVTGSTETKTAESEESKNAERKDSKNPKSEGSKSYQEIMDEIRKKAENEPKKTEEGPDWEVPRWVFPFVEGIFVMIGIAIGYNCLRSNAGYVDDKEWENMHSNK